VRGVGAGGHFAVLRVHLSLLQRAQSGTNIQRCRPAEDRAPKYRAVAQLVPNAAGHCIPQLLILYEEWQPLALKEYFVLKDVNFPARISSLC
jgi:hypothetical protein